MLVNPWWDQEPCLFTARGILFTQQINNKCLQSQHHNGCFLAAGYMTSCTSFCFLVAFSGFLKVVLYCIMWDQCKVSSYCCLHIQKDSYIVMISTIFFNIFLHIHILKKTILNGQVNKFSRSLMRKYLSRPPTEALEVVSLSVTGRVNGWREVIIIGSHLLI